MGRLRGGGDRLLLAHHLPRLEAHLEGGVDDLTAGAEIGDQFFVEGRGSSRRVGQGCEEDAFADIQVNVVEESIFGTSGQLRHLVRNKFGGIVFLM